MTTMDHATDNAAIGGAELNPRTGLGQRCGRAVDVSVSVLWLQFLTSSTSELGDGGASFDHEHQQQGNTVPLALQGVE